MTRPHLLDHLLPKVGCMTRPTRLVLAVSAALFVTGFAAVQVSGYARQPLVAEVAPAGADIARETSCNALRERYRPAYNVWRGSVKKDREQVDQLDEMRAILRRIGYLERHGRCGG